MFLKFTWNHSMLHLSSDTRMGGSNMASFNLKDGCAYNFQKFNLFNYANLLDILFVFLASISKYNKSSLEYILLKFIYSLFPVKLKHVLLFC